MNKLKKLRVGTINITIQPHNEDMYIQLFQSVFKSKTSDRTAKRKHL